MLQKRIRIEGAQFDEERALYNLTCADVVGCRFAGPADGESALKEARDVRVSDTVFELRYPLWHVRGFSLDAVRMTEAARAALWYAEDGAISGSELHGIKALRECGDVVLRDCDIASAEFGWKCRGISLTDSRVASEYLFLDSRDIRLKNVRMSGKYSFQYVENLEIADSRLDTKDAFWHSRNVTVRNSVVKGEYLGWFSEGLTLGDCEIAGTQPLCYRKDLTLANCTMDGCDLAFEYSDVAADVRGRIDSVKNPRSGVVVADSVGSVILDDAVMDCAGVVKTR